MNEEERRRSLGFSENEEEKDEIVFFEKLKSCFVSLGFINFKNKIIHESAFKKRLLKVSFSSAFFLESAFISYAYSSTFKSTF